MNKFQVVSVTTMSCLLVGCSSIDLSAPIEDRSTGGVVAPTPVVTSPAQTQPVEIENAPKHLIAEKPAQDSGRTHTVGAGDTLYNIGVRYGVDPRQLASLNRISDPTKLSLGQVLMLPVATESFSAVQEEKPGETPATPTIIEGQTVNAAASDVTVEVATRPETPDQAQQRLAKQQQEYKAAASRGEIQLKWPTQGKVISTFKDNKFGIDIAGEMGQPITCVLDGTVQYVGNNTKGYGQFLIVKHAIRLPGKGSIPLISVYGNTSKILVRINEMVRAGQVIAEMGNSDSDQVKLRFELRQGRPIDPMQYLEQH